MLSIGEIIDKLIIENIKLFSLREKLMTIELNTDEYNSIQNKIDILNKNRNVIVEHLNEKIQKVIDKKEKNVLVQNVRTYEATR